MRLFVYNILSIQTHNKRNIFWQLVNETAYCCNNIVLILMAIISSKKVCEKMENNSTLEKVLLVRNRNAELLQLVGATFDLKVASLRRMRKKYLQKKNLSFVVLFVCRGWHLSSQILIESVQKIVICALNVLMTMLCLKFSSILSQFAFLLSNNKLKFYMKCWSQ